MGEAERRIERVQYSERFLKHAAKLPTQVVARAEARERLFRANAFGVRLRTHKLHGKDKDLWAFWVDYHYRIKFLFLDDHSVLFLDIGRHDEVY